jgi:membrane protease YdiL (CAAX protease family)
MLPEKLWKADAVLRLFGSVLICGFFLSSLVGSAIGFWGLPQKASPLLFLTVVGVAGGCFLGALIILSRPWRYEEVSRNLLILAGCVYAGMALSWWAAHWRNSHAGTEHSSLRVLVAVLSFQGVALVLIRQFVREHRIGWTEAFGFKIEWKRAVVLGVAATFLFLPFGWVLQWASAAVMEWIHLQPQEQTAVEVLRASDAWLNRFTLGFAAILIVPWAEEILFRGILYPAFRQRGYPRLAWWGTSLAFGAVHCNLATFLPLTLLALMLVWIYERTDNLLAPITAHTLFNAVNFAMLYLVPDKFIPSGPP